MSKARIFIELDNRVFRFNTELDVANALVTVLKGNTVFYNATHRGYKVAIIKDENYIDKEEE